MLRILVEGWRSLSDWIVAMDIGGKLACSVKGDIGLMGEAGWVEDSMMGSTLVREDRDEIEAVDMVKVMDGMEKVGIKSG